MITPVLNENPNTLTNKSSNHPATVTNPGMIPYRITAKSTTDTANEIPTPFQLNLNFLK